MADDVASAARAVAGASWGSSGGHNGFKSIAQHLGTDELARLRHRRRRGDDRRDLADHVLAKFDADERDAVAAMIDRAADAVRVFARDGIAAVMNRFNAGPAEERSETTTARRTVKTDAAGVWPAANLTPCPANYAGPSGEGPSGGPRVHRFNVQKE